MSVDLIKLATDAIGGNFFKLLGPIVGTSESSLSSGFPAIASTIFNGMMNKSSSSNGASAIFDFIKDRGLDGDSMLDIEGLLGNKDSLSKLGGLGEEATELLFGKGQAQDSVLSGLASHLGLGKGLTGSILKMVAPFILSAIGRYVKSKALNAVGLGSLLSSNKGSFAQFMPAASASTGFAANAPHTPNNNSSKGGFGWALPLLLLLGLAWFVFSKLGGTNLEDYEVTKNVTKAVTNKAAEANKMVQEKAASVIEESANTAKAAIAKTKETAANAVKDVVTKTKEEATNAIEKVKAVTIKLSDGSVLETANNSLASKFYGYLKGAGTAGTYASKSFVFESLNFKSGSDVIESSLYNELNEVGTILKSFPETKIVLEGHTDSSGDSDANKVLSQNRAKSVMEYLASKGVPTQRVRFAGYGSEKPIADNSTPEGMRKNRRVTIAVDK